MTKQEDRAAERAAMEAQDLAIAKKMGLVPPEPGTTGRYYGAGGIPTAFEVVEVKGMICYCRYSHRPADEVSSFIWGFGITRGKPEYNILHAWPGRPDWSE
jgi:hypothetical protein